MTLPAVFGERVDSLRMSTAHHDGLSNYPRLRGGLGLLIDLNSVLAGMHTVGVNTSALLMTAVKEATVTSHSRDFRLNVYSDASPGSAGLHCTRSGGGVQFQMQTTLLSEVYIILVQCKNTNFKKPNCHLSPTFSNKSRDLLKKKLQTSGSQNSSVYNS